MEECPVYNLSGHHPCAVISVPESTIRYIIRKYLKRRKQRMLSYSLKTSPLSELVESCFSYFSRQFMQIKFIIKGGILVTSLVGVSMRSTMDIDSTIRNLNLSEDEIAEIIEKISKIDLDDGVTFQITEVSPIMDEMEYPGIRLSLDALMGKMITPIKIDISTGDVITPRAIEYSYKLMLEDRAINLWTYNLETILAEKLQTVLVRGILNTRMRDFYDIHTLISAYGDRMNEPIFRKAFEATCEKRGTPLSQSRCSEIIDGITSDDVLIKLWSNYQKKYSYASSISYESIIDSIKHLNTIATK